MNIRLQDLKPLLLKLDHWAKWTFAIWLSGGVALTLVGENHEVISVLILTGMVVLILPSTRKAIFEKINSNTETSALLTINTTPDNPKLKHCTACNGIMAKTVNKCPHCGERNIPNLKFAIIATLLIIFGLPISCVMAISSIEPTPITNDTDLSRYAHLQCTKAAKEKLRSPASAKDTGEFKWGKDPNKQTYSVKFAMDSQNSFGALIRSNWVCQIEYLSGNQIDQSSWKITDLTHN